MNNNQSRLLSFLLVATAGAGVSAQISTCQVMNSNDPVGIIGFYNGTYAIRVQTAQAQLVHGFGIPTFLFQGGPTLPTALYRDVGGRPAMAPVRTSSMAPTTNQAPAWTYTSFSPPLSVSAGETYYISFGVPTPSTIIRAPISGSVNPTRPVHFYRPTTSIAVPWTPPLFDAWMYNIQCEVGGGTGGGGGTTGNISYWGQQCGSNKQFWITGTPNIGETLTFRLSGYGAPALKLLYLGLSNQSWWGLSLPFNLTPYGGYGCMWHISPDVLLGWGTAFNRSYTLPAATYAVGLTIYGQYLIIRTDGVLFSTRGSAITIGS